MKIRQLEAFRAVMVYQTVTRAAEALFISQPATTRLIADLEESVGFPLFLRARGRLYPTPEALSLNEEVMRSLVGVERIARAAEDIRTQQRGSLQIAAAPAIAISLLPRAIAEFVATRPEAKISLLMHSSRTVVDMVLGQRCDVGFPILSVDMSSTHGELLFAARLVCAVPAAHRLSNRQVIRPEDLEGESFISHPKTIHTRLETDSMFAAHGVERDLRIECQVSMSICTFVEAGLGVSLVEAITASVYRGDGVRFIPFEPAMKANFSVLTPIDRKPSLLLQAFIAHVREYAYRTIDERFIVR
jgi:DNA-binding transcriptional LysR family regulator